MAYLLDANVLIQAKNAHYGFAFCPAFWDWVVAANSTGKVFVISEVLSEISKGKDQLKNWCGMNPALRAGTAAALPTSMATLATWVITQSYDQNAINTFLSVADYPLVAHAHAGGHTVVTHEVAVAQTSPKRIKIPEPCAAFGIPYMTPFQMLEVEGASFKI